MTFTEEIKTELSGPLNSSNVKERKNYGGGGTLSYLESWFVIQEANRIFGFDGWTRETLQIERVATTPYNKDNREMMAVSYMARVRVTVGDIVREGCGYGDGQASVD
jgi:DNA repair and recombination protein RAD52